MSRFERLFFEAFDEACKEMHRQEMRMSWYEYQQWRWMEMWYSLARTYIALEDEIRKSFPKDLLVKKEK